ncbi:MAG: ABC transporter ATP-binding protein [Ferruginibacter sp.]
MNILSVEDLKKYYGPVKALDGITFSVPEGTVFGILGPNGSGKTTLLGIVMNVLKSSGGSYKLFDEEPNPSHRRKIGTLLETPNFYHYLTAVQNLKITSSIKEVNEKDIDRVLDIVSLSARKNSKFSTYSLGMKQRLAIASALLGNPDVLVFDEPTNGLDPVGISEIRNLIKELQKMGKTIIMASHLLDEVEKVCTHVAILKKGKIISSGNVNEIFTQNDIVELEAENIQALSDALKNLPGIVNVAQNGNTLIASINAGEVKLAEINRHLFDKGVVLTKLNLKRKSLESKFIELTN